MKIITLNHFAFFWQSLKPIHLTFFIFAYLASFFIFAEEKTDADRYPAAFFEQYRPQNALEMIELLPGFNFDRGSNARGFGGNAGNVLIDGGRPSSKSGGIRTALLRIPTSQVERIEILRGGVSSGEAAGQSVVANVITKNNVTSGRWAFKERWTSHVKVQPNLELAIATQLGDWKSAFDIDIGARESYRTADIKVVDASNSLESSSSEILSDIAEFAFANAQGITDVGSGKLTLNARIGGNRYSQDTNRDIFIARPVDSGDRDQFWDINVKSKFKTGEFSVDWVNNINDWKWHIIGLSLIEDRKFENQFHSEDINEGSTFDSQFVQDALSSENIARITFGRSKGAQFKPEYGVEFARNKLTSDSLSFVNDLQQILNGGNVVVEELRLETFATFVYSVNPQFILEGGLTGELSEIKVSGDSSQKQNFTFLKPRLSLTFKANENNQIVWEIERRVGQLNFRDFAASSQVSDERTTSGNPNLAPDTTDEFAVTYDWSFNQRGSLKIKAFYQQKSDILEQILLPSGGQGIGNAGDATFWGIATDLNLPLDALLPNGLLELSHVYRDSDFDDPIISRSRTINNFTPNSLDFKLRQDLTDIQLAWGMEYSGSFTNTNYFVDERRTFSGNKRLRVFIETSRYFNSKIQLEISDINTARFDRTRYIYQDNRGGIFDKTETANRIRQPNIKLTISRNF